MSSKTKKTTTQAPETIAVPVAEIQQHNQLLTALATGLTHLLPDNTGVVIALQGQLHIVSKNDKNDISVNPVTSNDQLAPGQVVNMAPPVQPETTTAESPTSEVVLTRVPDDVATEASVAEVGE